MMRRRLQGWVVPALVLALWAALDALGLLRHRALAGPAATGRALLGAFAQGVLAEDVAATAFRVVAAVALAVVPGAVLGFWIGSSRRHTRLLEPSLDFLRSVPPLLVLPLFLMALGYGDVARIAAATWAATWVVALHISAGAQRGNPERARFLSALGATRWQRLKWLRLPEILPHTFVALRHGLSTSLVVTVVTEMMLGAARGLGGRAMSAQIAYDVPLLYGVILLTGAMGFVASELLLALERKLVSWVA